MVTAPATADGLKVEALACLRGEARLFAGLSFQLAPGQGLFVRGANGVGKSSLLKILAGLLTRASGEIAFAGRSVADDLHSYRRHIAYLGHLDGLKPSETPRQALGFLASLRGNSAIDLGAFTMAAQSDMKIRYLSAGQRRRVALAGIVSSGAELWLLDEPTTALDDEASRLVYDALTRHLQNGGMFVVATHDTPPTIAGASIMDIVR